MAAFDFLRKAFAQKINHNIGLPDDSDALPSEMLFQDQAQERLVDDLRVLGTEEASDATVERTQKTAQKEVREAAEQSLKRLHVLQRGRCPQCGDALRQHLFVSVCDTCGWSSWSTPRAGNVRVHIKDREDPILGDKAYVVKDGVTIILRGETVFARIPSESVSWIEYVWSESEIRDRERGLRERMSISCGWCNNETDPDKDGFHLVHAAFGTTQERYCFCSDDCYEAFRKMYPARIHRNCYERDCDECNLCIKRYRVDSGGMRTLAKDLLKVK